MDWVSIVIPVRNQLGYTKQILEDIKEKIVIPYEILVIDDNSDQETKNFLVSRDDIKLFTYDYDIWVNQARNIGYEEAKYDKVLIINNDIVFDPWCIEKLVKALDDYDIVSPWTTEWPRKFELPVFMRTQNICGWWYWVRKWLPCFPIPAELDLRYGDDWIWQMTDKTRIGEVPEAIVHHYVSSTIGIDWKRSMDVEERIAGDTYEYAKICHEKWRDDLRFNNIKRDD